MSRHSVVEVKKQPSKWDLYWKDLGYVVKGSGKGGEDFKRVLANCSGLVKPGEIIAILGPSGAGKTTLLNVLAGRADYGTLQGSVLANGRKRDSSWKRVAAYVEQDDILYADLTVRETLLFAAKLRLPEKMSEEEKIHRADSLLQALGLTHIANSRIGGNEKRGISGGERKRVSIAIELVSDPGIVFLDEPTSGLDSFIATTVADKARELAKVDNKAVLLTIHQPRVRILNLFDKIILMSQGQMVFFGSVPEALDHFKKLGFECPQMENPADFFLDMITVDRRSLQNTNESQKRIDYFVQVWAQHMKQALPPAPASSAVKEEDVENAGFFSELAQLTVRFMRVKFRDRKDALGAIAQVIIFTVGTIALHHVSKKDMPPGIQERLILHLILIAQLFTTCIPYSQVYLKDKEIIRRERCSSTYGPLACFIGKFLSLLPVQILYTTLAGTALYFGCGFNGGAGPYFAFLLALILMNLASMAFALMIAAAIGSTTVASRLGAVGTAVFTVFGGAAFNLDNKALGLYIINYFSPFYYCYLALKYTIGAYNSNLLEASKEMSVAMCFVGSIGLTLLYSALGWLSLKLSTKPRIKLN